MSKEVLINAGAGEIRVALVEDGRLQDLALERTVGLDEGSARNRAGGRSGHSLVGNIILGRVQRVLPGMQAAFVDIGMDRAGFLGAREARCLADLPGFEEERAPKIGDCVHEGEEILVQVVKDPIGEKGARLSANVTIPGRLAVLVPNQPGIALSRRIEGDEERGRMIAMGEAMIAEGGDRLVPGAGYILRTAATEAQEFGFSTIRCLASSSGKAPSRAVARNSVSRPRSRRTHAARHGSRRYCPCTDR